MNITITIKNTLRVKGARGLERELDLTRLDPDTLERILDYWFGVVTSRASAGVDAFADKVEAETAMADKLVAFDWAKGGGGGSRLSVRAQAEREVLSDLFQGQGIKKTLAEKHARGKDAWADFIRLGMCRAQNRSDVSQTEVTAELERQQPEINSLIDDREAALREAAARAKKLTESGLSFGSA